MWYVCFVSPVTCSAYFFVVPFGLNTLLWEFRGTNSARDLTISEVL